MAKPVIIEIAEVGPVLFERSKRAKHLNISVRPFVGVRAAVPYRMSLEEAKKVVLSHKSWIQKHLRKIKKLKRKHEFLLDIASDINRVYARKRLVNRLNELALQHDFNFNKVFIRNQKTRWGSCSEQNNINLNIKLVLLPVDLMDYVILHELVHTHIKNHSQAFWRELDSLVSDAKRKHRKLKEYGLTFL